MNAMHEKHSRDYKLAGQQKREKRANAGKKRIKRA